MRYFIAILLFFPLLLSAAPWEVAAPYSLPESEEYELEFTLLSSTEYDIYEPGVGTGFGWFVLANWPYVYIGCTIWGIMVWDVSDPTHPIMLSHGNSGGLEPDLGWGLGDFDIYQDTLLIGALEPNDRSGLIVVNVADPMHPFHITSLEILGHTNRTLVGDNIAYQSWFEEDGGGPVGLNGLITYDISDPAHPVFADSVRVPGLQAFNFWFWEDYAYVFNRFPVALEGICIVNIGDPYNLEYIDSVGFFMVANGVAYDNYLYVLGYDESKVYDIHDPCSPVEIATFGAVPGSYTATFSFPYICATTGAGFAMVDISVPESTHIAGWQPFDQCWAGVWADTERGLVYASSYYEFKIFQFTDSALWEIPQKPDAYSICAYPNPFNESCRISAPAGAMVEIFDLGGGKVSRLGGSAGINPPADHINPDESGWGGSPINGASGDGQRGDLSPCTVIWQPSESISSGIYFVRATAGEKTISKRIVYLR